MRPSHTNLVLEKLTNSSSTPLYRKGVRLGPGDSRTVRDVYQQWLLILMDLDYLHPETFERTARRLYTDMVRVDVLTLNNAFTDCLQLIRLQTNKGLKGLCSVISSHLYHLLMDDIARMTRGDVRSAKRLMQVFAYTGRLSLQGIDLTGQMLEEYLDVEEAIPDEYPMPLVYRLNNIVKRWMKSFDPARIRPRHGQKGVAFLGRASYEDKYKNLSTDQMLRYAFGDPDWVCDLTLPPLERMSQTMFVPKSFKSFRTISMEPVTLMYFQQGVWREIDRVVRRSTYLRDRICFEEQSRNTELAKRGSIERNYATIDLSSASDSVSYKLVKEVFRGTKLLRYIFATRSRKTLLPDGRVIVLKKFAPMGSALCFPIETILFASICELVTRELRVSGDYSVYGDDIIVPTQCAERTMEILERLGFRVNHEKSFHLRTCWFRESCGGEYCDGFDVTPLRVTRKYTHRERDVRLNAYIDSANNAYLKGYRHLRGFYLQKIRSMGFRPLFAPSSVLADNYTNYHTKRRWNVKLQRVEVLATMPKTHYKTEDLNRQDESIRYRHWLECTADREYVSRAFESIICKSTESIKDSWREKPYEPSDQRYIDASPGGGKIRSPWQKSNP